MTVGRSSSPTHQIGAAAEQLAAQYVQAKGWQVVAENFHCRLGEIDLIIRPNTTEQLVVFVEVRSRKRGSFGDAMASVTAAKQRKLCKTAAYFLQVHPEFSTFDCRFDVIAVQLDKSPVQFEWIEAAFMAD